MAEKDRVYQRLNPLGIENTVEMCPFAPRPQANDAMAPSDNLIVAASGQEEARSNLSKAGPNISVDKWR